MIKNKPASFPRVDNICYAFQCYMNGEMVHDTGLISLDEAKGLWDAVEKVFTKCCAMGGEAEIAIWMDMDTPDDYHTQYKGVHSSEVIISNGTAYVQEPVF